MGLITNNLTDMGPALLDMGSRVEVPTWQALDVRDKPQGATIELENTLLHAWKIPSTVEYLQHCTKPNLPWAENQFLERVGGKPLNPGETFKEWPWYKGNVEQHQVEDHGHKFSHTYMERYWPVTAGRGEGHPIDVGRNRGIRYNYGDLNDVINLLAREPTTRQAYLPVFFPEDTGAVHGERIPCSLGYLFLMREGKLNITYYIRSCDFLRHFKDDVYMTARLCQWVLEQLQVGNDAPADGPWDSIEPGYLTMHIGSLHVFEGDLPKLKREYANPK